MNTTTHPETLAVQATAEVVEQEAARQAQAVLDQAQAEAAGMADAPAAELRFIALARLRLSKRDVRKTAAPARHRWLSRRARRARPAPCRRTR